MAEIRRSGRKKRPLADITNTAWPNASSISSSSSSSFLINPKKPKSNATPKLPNPNFSSSVNKPAHLAASSDFTNNEALEHSVYPNDSRSGKDKKHIVGRPTRIDQTVIPSPGSSTSSAAFILPPNASVPSQPSIRRLASVSTPALGTGDSGVPPRLGYTQMQSVDRSYKGKEIPAARPLSLSPARKIPGKGKEIAAAKPLSLSPASKIMSFWKEITDTRSSKDKNLISGGSTDIDQTVITNPCSFVSPAPLVLPPKPSSPQKLVSVTPAPGTDDSGVSLRSVYTRRRSANRSCIGKEIAAAQPLGLSPARRIPAFRSKRNDDGEITVPKSCTLPRKKKQKADLSSDKRMQDVDIKSRSCIMPSEKKQRLTPAKEDDSEFSLPQDFVDQQTAYFKEVDKFELAVEEVASKDELD